MTANKEHKEFLKELSSILARIHKGLMEFQMKEREKRTGQPLNPATRLQLLLGDAEFSWLRVLSHLMVKVDDVYFMKEGITEPLVAELKAEVTSLLVDQAHEEFAHEFNLIKGFLPDVLRDLEKLKRTLAGAPGLLH